MPLPTVRSRLVSPLLLIALVAVVGCSAQGDDAARGPVATAYAPNAYAVTGAELEAVDVGPGTLTFPRTATDVLARAPGDVLYSLEDGPAPPQRFPFVRHVVSVKETADAIVVTTTDGDVDDVLVAYEGDLAGAGAAAAATAAHGATPTKSLAGGGALKTKDAPAAPVGGAGSTAFDPAARIGLFRHRSVVQRPSRSVPWSLGVHFASPDTPVVVVKNGSENVSAAVRVASFDFTPARPDGRARKAPGSPFELHLGLGGHLKASVGATLDLSLAAPGKVDIPIFPRRFAPKVEDVGAIAVGACVPSHPSAEYACRIARAADPGAHVRDKTVYESFGVNVHASLTPPEHVTHARAGWVRLGFEGLPVRRPDGTIDPALLAPFAAHVRDYHRMGMKVLFNVTEGLVQIPNKPASPTDPVASYTPHQPGDYVSDTCTNKAFPWPGCKVQDDVLSAIVHRWGITDDPFFPNDGATASGATRPFLARWEEAFGVVVKELGKDIDTRPDVWEVLNEPDHPGTSLNAHVTGAILRAARRAVPAAPGGPRLAFGALMEPSSWRLLLASAVLASPDGKTPNPLWDVATFHFYPLAPSQWTAFSDAVRTVEANASFGKSMMVTEFGFDTELLAPADAAGVAAIRGVMTSARSLAKGGVPLESTFLFGFTDNLGGQHDKLGLVAETTDGCDAGSHRAKTALATFADVADATARDIDDNAACLEHDEAATFALPKLGPVPLHGGLRVSLSCRVEGQGRGTVALHGDVEGDLRFTVDVGPDTKPGDVVRIEQHLAFQPAPAIHTALDVDGQVRCDVAAELTLLAWGSGGPFVSLGPGFDVNGKKGAGGGASCAESANVGLYASYGALPRWLGNDDVMHAIVPLATEPMPLAPNAACSGGGGGGGGGPGKASDCHDATDPSAVCAAQTGGAATTCTWDGVDATPSKARFCCTKALDAAAFSALGDCSYYADPLCAVGSVCTDASTSTGEHGLKCIPQPLGCAP